LNIKQPTNSIEQSTSSPDSALNIKPLAVDSEISILGLLLISAKYKKMVLLTTLATTLIAIIYSILLPNIYTAKAMILPDDSDNGVMGSIMAQMGGLAAVAAGVGLGGPTKADLYVTMLNSETVMSPIIDRYKLLDIYNVKFRFAAYKALDKNSNMTTGKKDGVITISVDDKDPKLAAAIANTYVDELDKMVARLSKISASNNRIYLEEQLTSARADLVKAENALKDFQIKYKAISVSDQAKATIEGVAQLRAQLAIQEVQLGTLQRQFTDSSQDVKNIKSSVSNLRMQIDKLEGSSRGSSSIPTVGSLPGLGQDYFRLMREFKIQEAIVDILTKQYELTKLSEVKNVSSFKLLQKANVPEIKSKPKRSLIVVLAAITAFLCSIIIAFFRDFIIRLPSEEQKKWKELLSILSYTRNK